ncbi:MAG: class I SAM-dependent methyltransferase [Spirochaetales bacterium]|nr:class I SAM-dependent methyltransferase [Spirochaetales bacterium]
MNNLVKDTFSSKKHSENYDQKTRNANWLAPEIAFGMAFSSVEKGDSLLDLGIGTGLSSALFHRAGLSVYGMDFSEEMLKLCRQKGTARKVITHDLMEEPYPFPTDSMDHGICLGVSHILPDLSLIMGEMFRILRPGGLFVFSVIHRERDEEKTVPLSSKELPGKSFTFYRYSREEIEEDLKKSGFTLVSRLNFLSLLAGKERLFTIYMIRRGWEDYS